MCLSLQVPRNAFLCSCFRFTALLFGSTVLKYLKAIKNYKCKKEMSKNCVLYSERRVAMTIEELSDELINYGREQKMQDMYLYLLNEHAIIYFRKNAQLFKHKELSCEQAQQLILRFKYLGEMDVGEKRKAQLGAISYLIQGYTQRLRLSTVGDYQGNESLVIRFLYNLKQEKPAYFFPQDAELIQKKNSKRKGTISF